MTALLHGYGHTEIAPIGIAREIGDPTSCIEFAFIYKSTVDGQTFLGYQAYQYKLDSVVPDPVIRHAVKAFPGNLIRRIAEKGNLVCVSSLDALAQDQGAYSLVVGTSRTVVGPVEDALVRERDSIECQFAEALGESIVIGEQFNDHRKDQCGHTRWTTSQPTLLNC